MQCPGLLDKPTVPNSLGLSYLSFLSLSSLSLSLFLFLNLSLSCLSLLLYFSAYIYHFFLLSFFAKVHISIILSPSLLPFHSLSLFSFSLHILNPINIYPLAIKWTTSLPLSRPKDKGLCDVRPISACNTQTPKSTQASFFLSLFIDRMRFILY